MRFVTDYRRLLPVKYDLKTYRPSDFGGTRVVGLEGRRDFITLHKDEGAPSATFPWSCEVSHCHSSWLTLDYRSQSVRKRGRNGVRTAMVCLTPWAARVFHNFILCAERATSKAVLLYLINSGACTRLHRVLRSE